MEVHNESIRIRPRRNRKCEAIRSLVRETSLSSCNLILPLFVQEGIDNRTPIASMPGCFRLSVDLIIEIGKEAHSLGVAGIALFPSIPHELKTEDARESWNDNGLLQRCVSELKTQVPGLLVITDVAMDPYSPQGHDGYVDANGNIDNDITIPILCRMAVSQAKAGADFVAPSDMMDGRVGALRKALDEAGFKDVGICSYSVKYCSSFYGPFRDALDSAPRGGDKKTYQMDAGNVREALREAKLDEQEGADWLMVKPGLPYLDVVRAVKEITDLPVAIYHVSGEYAMLKAAAANGWLDYNKCLLETLLSMRRAGASIIFTYGAIEAARILQDSR